MHTTIVSGRGLILAETTDRKEPTLSNGTENLTERPRLLTMGGQNLTQADACFAYSPGLPRGRSLPLSSSSLHTGSGVDEVGMRCRSTSRPPFDEL
jgi:hypothetical protein